MMNEKENISESVMLRSVKQSIKTITTETGGLKRVVAQHHLNGTFKQLCDNEKMSEILFPGTSKDVLRDMPKSLKEVLLWNELELDYQKIAKSACDVLAGIKKKGALVGDVMDSSTEQILLPQIAQEALAKGVIDAVRKLSRKVSGTNAKVSIRYAAADSAQAQLDQLDSDVVLNLWRAPFISEQCEYFGAEFAVAVYKDLVRFVRYEKLSPLNPDGSTALTGRSCAEEARARMAWTEPHEIETTYPALFDALVHMHALPYELNSDIGDGVSKQLKLLEPSRGCTMVVHYPARSVQQPRLDSHGDGGELDSGIRISCAYHLSSDILRCSEETAERNDACIASCAFTSPASRDVVLKVPVKSDSLMMYQSTKHINERTPAEKDYFAIYFFIKGKEIDLLRRSEISERS